MTPTNILVEYYSHYYIYQQKLRGATSNKFTTGLSLSVQDCEDSNPLIRALAVRTMGCIRVDKITEYVCEPLRKCLKDEDPYVRKTAAVCVAKLHDINAQLVEDQGFLDMLRDLLSDSNPMVSKMKHMMGEGAWQSKYNLTKALKR